MERILNLTDELENDQHGIQRDVSLQVKSEDFERALMILEQFPVLMFELPAVKLKPDVSQIWVFICMFITGVDKKPAESHFDGADNSESKS